MNGVELSVHPRTRKLFSLPAALNSTQDGPQHPWRIANEVDEVSKRHTCNERFGSLERESERGISRALRLALPHRQLLLPSPVFDGVFFESNLPTGGEYPMTTIAFSAIVLQVFQAPVHSNSGLVAKRISARLKSHHDAIVDRLPPPSNDSKPFMTASLLQSPLTCIKQAATRWPSSPAFKIPIEGPGKFGGYNIITYTDFDADTLLHAKYWSVKLSKRRITPGEVVSICLEGYKYTDFLHIFGLIRAGTIQCAPESGTELRSMVEMGGLERAFLFPSALTKLLRQSREDSELLSLLVHLKGICFTGGAVPLHELEYAKRSGINIKIDFGSTECSMMLVSKELRFNEGDEPGYLYPIPTVLGDSDEASRNLFAYRFVPYETGELKELVILLDSADCPHKTFCNSDDGCYHTGDLFEEISAKTDSELPKRYLFRGRKDDWIKVENAGFCDAGDSPTLTRFDHRTKGRLRSLDGDAKSRNEIFRRITSLESHSTRYSYERIESSELIIVAAPRSLIRTRTKENVARKKTEEAFGKKLDRVYDGVRDV
ncbi:hypothetical protein L218DRAFT_990687 [Marasmius fiardii PR-910]|nr:hypothetical protein L218DRAFT_990687 [Marasmius fiardii PR-910]